MVDKRKKTTSESSTTRKVAGRELRDLEELVLPASKLRFCSEQLQNLNYIFTKKLSLEPDPEYSKALLLAKAVTERLIQRLLCGVGHLDPRFATKFLVALHDNDSSSTSHALEYLLRLDSLSKPALYSTDQVPKYSVIEGDLENCPAGYARIRLHPSSSRIWADFINSSGFLRRDKIQAKVVELLAVAASGDTPNSPLMVDESVLCGAPGKVVDPLTLHNILHFPADQHIFYGPAGKTPRFPDPRDFKLAIVDEPSGIRVRVGFLSPALASISIEVRLLVAVGLDVWPSATNFPFRIPVGHSDCVLYHKAAQTGMYLTGYGVQSSAWQIRLPAAESVLEKHYSQNSIVTAILQTLHGILQDIDDEYRRHQISYRILNNYALRSGLLYQLEEDLSGPTEIILNWSLKYLSTHVLSILDNLISTLRRQRQPNYFFPNANLLINPGHLCEDDFVLESNKIQAHMLKFFDESLTSLRANEDFNNFIVSQKTELTLLNKWKDLVDGLMPPPSTRGRRMCFAGSRYKREVVYTQYTTRQLEYIGIMLKNMLLVKQTVMQGTEDYPWAENLQFPGEIQEDPIEDIIYILVTLIEQARDRFLENLPDSPTLSVTRSKLKRQFDMATSRLVEVVRKEKEVTNLELVDDTTLVKIILKWLYKGLDQNKKSLAPVLRPYLRILFTTSHGASWHLEAIKKQDIEEEVKALGMFAKLVNLGSITPAQGLVDSISKNWNWAKNMLKVIEQGNLRLIFVPSRGKMVKHILSLPESEQRLAKDASKSLDCLKIKTATCEWPTLPRRHYLSTILIKSSNSSESDNDKNNQDYKPMYCILRDTSSMTLTFSQFHRRGEHRCCGDILQTLMAMQKVNVLQEVSTLLPNEERMEILEAIQKLTNERGKRTISRKKSNTFIQLSNSRRKSNPETSSEEPQKYTPKEESAGIREMKQEHRDCRENGGQSKGRQKFLSKRWNREEFLDDDRKNEGTLIGSCRAARIRDDTNVIHFHDNFKIQSLMKHSSFKY